MDVIGLDDANLRTFDFTYEAEFMGVVPPEGIDTFLDGALLTVTYTAPGADGLSGCQLGGEGACALLKAGGEAKIAIQGTIYAPTAAITVNLDDVSTPPFGRDVVVRKIILGARPANGYLGPLVSGVTESGLPSDIGGHVLTVQVKGRDRLRARVEFPPGRSPSIRSWNVLP